MCVRVFGFARVGEQIFSQWDAPAGRIGGLVPTGQAAGTGPSRLKRSRPERTPARRNGPWIWSGEKQASWDCLRWIGKGASWEADARPPLLGLISTITEIFGPGLQGDFDRGREPGRFPRLEDGTGRRHRTVQPGLQDGLHASGREYLRLSDWRLVVPINGVFFSSNDRHPVIPPEDKRGVHSAAPIAF
jgi:hypothetical protein